MTTELYVHRPGQPLPPTSPGPGRQADPHPRPPRPAFTEAEARMARHWAALYYPPIPAGCPPVHQVRP